MTDMHKRADTLRAFINDCRHVATEDFEDLGIDLDGEIPKVPYRYVASEYSEDREGTYLEFAGSLEEARRSNATGWVVDLDTGDRWEIELHATLHPLPWTVKTTSRLSNAVSVVRYRTEAHAQAYVQALSDADTMPHDDEGPFVTVLDGPTYEWHGEPERAPEPIRELLDELRDEARALRSAQREGRQVETAIIAEQALRVADWLEARARKFQPTPAARELAGRIDRYDQQADAASERDREGFMDDARALARLVLESEDA